MNHLRSDSVGQSVGRWKVGPKSVEPLPCLRSFSVGFRWSVGRLKGSSEEGRSVLPCLPFNWHLQVLTIQNKVQGQYPHLKLFPRFRACLFFFSSIYNFWIFRFHFLYRFYGVISWLLFCSLPILVKINAAEIIFLLLYELLHVWQW